jgi:hypothetical protein
MRNALVGGATGASIGALTGGLVASSNPRKEVIEKVFGDGISVGMSGLRKSLAEGNPSEVEGILSAMNPQAREAVFSKFRKGWLTRMFGG